MGVTTKETPFEVAEASDVVITMLPSPSHVSCDLFFPLPLEGVYYLTCIIYLLGCDLHDQPYVIFFFIRDQPYVIFPFIQVGVMFYDMCLLKHFLVCTGQLFMRFLKYICNYHERGENNHINLMYNRMENMS